MPDSEVLLSDLFLDTHCLTVVSGKDEDSGLMGLVFRHLENRGVTDISGVLWLDEKSARLKRLDVRYENMPALDRVRSRVRNQIGGQVVFEGLPTGAWLVRYRTALLDSLGMTPAPAHVETQAGEEALVQLWVPSRGDLIEVACEGQVAAEGSALIVGTALSAEDGQPHPDAAVQIVWDGSNEGGRRLRTKTAEDGSFTICGVPLETPVRVRVFIRGELGPAETLRLSRPGASTHPAPPPQRL